MFRSSQLFYLHNISVRETAVCVFPLFFLLRSNGLVVKVLDFQSRDPVFKTTGWLQGHKMSTRNIWKLKSKK